MLDLSHEQDLIADTWDKVATPHLPQQMIDFFEHAGAMPAKSGCRRAYQRFYIRGKAILRRSEDFYGVYTADASRQGLRFLSPVPLTPSERCRIRLPKTKEFQIEIIRCRRLDDDCYDCGAMFVLSIPGAAE